MLNNTNPNMSNILQTNLNTSKSINSSTLGISIDYNSNNKLNGDNVEVLDNGK